MIQKDNIISMINPGGTFFYLQPINQAVKQQGKLGEKCQGKYKTYKKNLVAQLRTPFYYWECGVDENQPNRFNLSYPK